MSESMINAISERKGASWQEYLARMGVWDGDPWICANNIVTSALDPTYKRRAILALCEVRWNQPQPMTEVEIAQMGGRANISSAIEDRAGDKDDDALTLIVAHAISDRLDLPSSKWNGAIEAAVDVIQAVRDYTGHW